MRRIILALLAVAALVLVVAFWTGLLNVNQTQEGVLPEVSVEGGQLPAAEIETGAVEIGTETREIETPTINIVPAEESN